MIKTLGGFSQGHEQSVNREVNSGDKYKSQEWTGGREASVRTLMNTLGNVAQSRDSSSVMAENHLSCLQQGEEAGLYQVSPVVTFPSISTCLMQQQAC